MKIIITRPHRSVEFYSVDIEVHKSFGNPSELIRTHGTVNGFAGMVSIEHYGSVLLQHTHFDTGVSHAIMQEVLPFAVRQAASLLRMSRIGASDRRNHSLTWPYTGVDSDQEVIDKSILDHVANPFPNDFVISATVARLLDCPEPHHMKDLEKGHKLKDMPVIASHLDDLKKSCNCEYCDGPHSGEESDCELRIFWEQFSQVVAILLCLSLFECPEKLLLPLRTSHVDEGLLHLICAILVTGEWVECDVYSVFQCALSLVGHDVRGEIENSEWVMSSFKGQAVFPKLIETRRIADRGFLTLSCVPGIIYYAEETYTLVTATDQYGPDNEGDEEALDKPVDAPCNLTSDLRLEWAVSVHDGYLRLGGSVTDRDGTRKLPMGLDPLRIFKTLCSALVLQQCRHSSMSRLTEPDTCCHYTRVTELWKILLTVEDEEREGNIKEQEGHINVVAVAGNDGLRMFALGGLSSLHPVVLRSEACLLCCIKLCRKAKFSTIIC